jgi:hypothetical protein
MTSEKSPVTAWAQFFDDIRMEASGKPILIGQYVTDMVIPLGSMPVDRLAVLIAAKWPREYWPTTLMVRINMPGQPPIEAALPVPEKIDVSDKPLSPFSGYITQVAIQLRFAPLRAGDILDVWLRADEHDIPAGRLRITDGSSSQNAPSAQSLAVALTKGL